MVFYPQFKEKFLTLHKQDIDYKMQISSRYNSAPSLFDEYDAFQTIEYVRSPLNYIGGKFKLLPQIVENFPSGINTFVDLFCGGCNVGINVVAKHIVFNDNLTYLIDLYKDLKFKSFDEVVLHIEKRILEYNLSLINDEGYKNLRILYNTYRNPLDLFVLVAYSFNHQIRFNNSHEFNNPFGRERSSFNPAMRKNLEQFINRLHSISCEFTSKNFDEVNLSKLGENDFVYCDPPYLITTGTYNDGKRGFTGWGETEEIKLLSLLNRLNQNGVKFALSNVLSHKGRVNNLLIDWAYSNSYVVKHLAKSYANSNYHTLNRDINASDEVLILNYNPA